MLSPRTRSIIEPSGELAGIVDLAAGDFPL